MCWRVGSWTQLSTWTKNDWLCCSLCPVGGAIQHLLQAEESQRLWTWKRCRVNATKLLTLIGFEQSPNLEAFKTALKWILKKNIIIFQCIWQHESLTSKHNSTFRPNQWNRWSKVEPKSSRSSTSSVWLTSQRRRYSTSSSGENRELQVLTGEESETHQMFSSFALNSNSDRRLRSSTTSLVAQL